MIDRIYAPNRAAPPQRIAVSTTGAATALTYTTTGWYRVKVVTAGVSFQFLFQPDSTHAIVLDSGTPGQIGWHLDGGEGEDFWLAGVTHIDWDASGAGVVLIRPSGWPRSGRGHA